MTDNRQTPDEGLDNFYTLVPEQGLCLIEDTIINLRRITMIRKVENKTLVFIPGAVEPMIFPSGFFEKIREAVFLADDYDDDEGDDDEEQN